MKCRPADHCWHATGGVYHKPMRIEQQCCWCGEKRRVRSHANKKATKHGPHRP